MDMEVVYGLIVGAASLGVNGLIFWKMWDAFRTRRLRSLVGMVVASASTVIVASSLIVLSTRGVLDKSSPPVRLDSAQKAKLAILTQAVQGSVAASAPSAARQYVPFLLEMRVAPGNLPSALQETKASASSGTAVVGEDDITLTPLMEGRISGDGFTVEPKDRQAYSQMVAANKVTTWSWLVTPVSSGSQNLRIMLIGKVKVAEGDEVADHDLYAKSFDIKVQIDAPEYVKRNLVQLASMAGAAIAALATAFWAWWTWFNPKRDPPPPSMSPLPPIPRPRPGKTTDASRAGRPPADG